MKCNKQRLSWYLDGELSKEEKKIVEKHLKKCKACRELLSAYKKVDQKAENLGPDAFK